MDAADLLFEIIAVSASGVLAPGPMFLANMLYAARQGPLAGLKMAYGHTAVELPLIVLIAIGVFSVSAILDTYRSFIGIVGGIATLGFACLQVVSIVKPQGRRLAASPTSRGPFTAGILLSVFNPFFLIWWMTVGVKLIADSMSFGLYAGILMVFGLHIWMDYAWLVVSAYVSSKGTRYLGARYYRILILSLTGILAYFGVLFLFNSLN